MDVRYHVSERRRHACQRAFDRGHAYVADLTINLAPEQRAQLRSLLASQRRAAEKANDFELASQTAGALRALANAGPQR
jgi:hypothetical protein